MSFWKTMGWIAAGVAAPITGGASLAVAVGAGVATATVSNKAISKVTEKARSEGFDAGKAEKSIEVQKLKNAVAQQERHFKQHKDYEAYLVALTAVGMACAACDGDISHSERIQINEFVAGIASSKLPQSVKDEIEKITCKYISFNDAFKMAEAYMSDEESKQAFLEVIEITILADDKITTKEEQFLAAWKFKISA